MLRKICCAFALTVGFCFAAYAAEIHLSHLHSWELAFSSNPPRAIYLPDGARTAAFTYVIYQVSNTSSQDIDFYPVFQIESENGKVSTAVVYPGAEARIRERFGTDLLGFAKITGVIKPGETKKGVAVFKGVDATADKLTLYVSGLSGDFKMDEGKDGKLLVMYRTFKAVYYRPGDEAHLEIEPVTLQSSEWVWRE